MPFNLDETEEVPAGTNQQQEEEHADVLQSGQPDIPQALLLSEPEPQVPSIADLEHKIETALLEAAIPAQPLPDHEPEQHHEHPEAKQMLIP